VAAETPGGSAVASELPDVVERSGEVEAKAAAEMEVDGDRAGGERRRRRNRRRTPGTLLTATSRKVRARRASGR